MSSIGVVSPVSPNGTNTPETNGDSGFPLSQLPMSSAPNETHPGRQAIVICGIRLPGGVRDPEAFRDVLSLHDTLVNLQLLLRPGGLLVLTELCAVTRILNYVFGGLSGWWLGEADGRPYEPYVSVDRRHDELKAAGFSGVDTAVRDAEEPFQYCVAIVSTKVEEDKKQTMADNATKVSVVTEDPQGILAKNLVQNLSQAGISIGVFTLGDEKLPTETDIVSLVDLESFFFDNITQKRLETFQVMLKQHESGRILWLTKPAQVNSEDPRSAQTLGVARSIRAESQVPFYTLEIRPTEPHFLDLVHRVLTKIQHTEDVGLLAPDKEYVVDQGCVKIGRFQPFLVRKELQEASLTGSAQGEVTKSLHTFEAGSLENLTWVSGSLSPPGDDKVTIDTRAVGLNFKDVLHATGILKPDEGQSVPDIPRW